MKVAKRDILYSGVRLSIKTFFTFAPKALKVVSSGFMVVEDVTVVEDDSPVILAV